MTQPPWMFPPSEKWSWMNFPNRLELLLYTVLAFPNASMMGLQRRKDFHFIPSTCKGKAGECVCALRYLLCTMACSTRVLFSDGDVPAEFWLITDRNWSNSLVLSVFPAPDSPLEWTDTRAQHNSIKHTVAFSDIPVSPHSFNIGVWWLQRDCISYRVYFNQESGKAEMQ